MQRVSAAIKKTIGAGTSWYSSATLTVTPANDSDLNKVSVGVSFEERSAGISKAAIATTSVNSRTKMRLIPVRENVVVVLVDVLRSLAVFDVVDVNFLEAIYPIPLFAGNPKSNDF